MLRVDISCLQDGREQGREPDGGGVPQGLLARRRAVQDAGAQRGDIDPASNQTL